MIGDRMDTDIMGGLESGMTTCLVLSSVKDREIMNRFPYYPDDAFNNLGEIVPDANLSEETEWRMMFKYNIQTCHHPDHGARQLLVRL